AINPGTDVSVLEPFLTRIDNILVMSVQPGFGGQKFNSVAVDKIKFLNNKRKENNLNYVISVDGGINNETIHNLNDTGIDFIVVGSYLFSNGDIKEKCEKVSHVK